MHDRSGANAEYVLIGAKPDSAAVLGGVLDEEFSCTERGQFMIFSVILGDRGCPTTNSLVPLSSVSDPHMFRKFGHWLFSLREGTIIL